MQAASRSEFFVPYAAHTLSLGKLPGETLSPKETHFARAIPSCPQPVWLDDDRELVRRQNRFNHSFLTED
jgi:hypothetical protein